MRKAIFILAGLILGISTQAKSKAALPMASQIESPAVATVLVENSSSDTQYLGFDWVNSYCFGAYLGCAVSDRPAAISRMNYAVILQIGDWEIYATCTFGGMQFHYCGPVAGNSTSVQLRKNGTDLAVADTLVNGGFRGTIHHGSLYTVRSAYNMKSRALWGGASLDEWRIVTASLSISESLKKMSVDQQIAWAGKISVLRADGLLTADNLEAVLKQMSPTP